MNIFTHLTQITNAIASASASAHLTTATLTATLLFALLFTALTSSAYAQTESPATGRITISANVHTAAQTTADVVRKAKKGEVVTIISSNDNGTWHQIGDEEWIPALVVKLGVVETEEDATEATTSPLKLGDLLAKNRSEISATPPITESEPISPTAEPSSIDSSGSEASLTVTQPITVGMIITQVTRLVGSMNRDANVRSGPGTSFDVVERVEKEQEVEILQTGEGNYWYEINEDRWVASFLVDITGERVVTVTLSVPITSTARSDVTEAISQMAAITETSAISGTSGITETSATGTTATETSDTETSTAVEAAEDVAPDPIPFTMDPAFASRSANLRAGPGTDFEISSGVAAGAELEVTGQNEDGSWYYLASGDWIAAFLVSDEPPAPEPTPEPAQPEATQPEAAGLPAGPPSSGNEFVMIEKRLWDVNENGGYLDGPSVHCGFKRELHVHVLDRNGNRMNGVQAQVVYGAKEIMVTGSQGIGDGVASFVLGKGQDVKIVRAPDGREVTSDVATGLVTEPQYIDHAYLKAGRYCTDDASCQSFVNGNGCYAHYSWTVTFQELP